MFKSEILQEEDLLSNYSYKNGEAYIFSHKSLYDKPNQDCIGTSSFKGDCRVLIVSDGMGGHMGGEKASRIVCESIIKIVEGGQSNLKLRELLLDGIEIADQKVKDLKIGAGATLTAAIIEGNQVQFFNIGDSVSYLFGSRGKIKYRTIEHSPVGFALESGIIAQENPEEIEQLGTNIVSNGIGFETVRIEISQKIEVSEGDLIVLMSDGVSAHYSLEEIIQLTTKGSFEDRVKNYTLKAKEKPDQFFSDDNSFVLFKVS